MSDPAPELPNTPSNEPAPPEGEGANKPRRRGSRGGRNRNRARTPQADRTPDDLPDRIATNRPPAEVTEKALVRKPQIGDSMPAPHAEAAGDGDGDDDQPARRRRRRGGRGRGRGANRPVEASIGEAVELDAETLEKRRGSERKGRPVGRYLMAVHAQAGATQIAVLEGRSLIEHYVSRPQDDALQIHGNIYLGRVQNVLPGMEAAFVDIGTPKNAVLYRGDVQFDAEDVEGSGSNARIEQILKARQAIICQVTKNPIGAKGARLTQEVSLPGRFVVLIPNSSTYGISKRLSDDERKRLRSILDKIKPAEHGLIVRTAAEGATRE
ncbi:MAG: ribonuclease, partial [Actinomycetia bacterium]|nr:ribonuclease [Actinomycetes bacterium]